MKSCIMVYVQIPSDFEINEKPIELSKWVPIECFSNFLPHVTPTP